MKNKFIFDDSHNDNDNHHDHDVW